MQNLSDEQLMQMIKRRRREALSIMYDRYAPMVYSFAWKTMKDETDAREIVQSVFLRLWTTDSEYDPARGRFTAWLLAIVRNLCIDRIRQRRRIQQHTVSLPEESWDLIPDSNLASPEESAIRKATKQQIRDVYRHLSEQQISLLEHFYWRGYSLMELAELYGQPLGTVKSRLHQTLKILRRHLATEGERW